MVPAFNDQQSSVGGNKLRGEGNGSLTYDCLVEEILQMEILTVRGNTTATTRKTLCHTEMVDNLNSKRHCWVECTHVRTCDVHLPTDVVDYAQYQLANDTSTAC